MRVEGIGPSTSVLSGQRSTTELHTHIFTHLISLIYQKNPRIVSKNPLFCKQNNLGVISLLKTKTRNKMYGLCIVSRLELNNN